MTDTDQEFYTACAEALSAPLRALVYVTVSNAVQARLARQQRARALAQQAEFQKLIEESKRFFNCDDDEL